MPGTNPPKRLVKSNTLSALFRSAVSSPVSRKPPQESAEQILAKGNAALTCAFRRFHQEIFITKFLNTEENTTFLYKLLGIYPDLLARSGVSTKDHQISVKVIGDLRTELDKLSKWFGMYRGMIEASEVFKESKSLLAHQAEEQKNAKNECWCINGYLSLLKQLLLSDMRFIIHIRKSLVMLEFHQSQGIKPIPELKQAERPMSPFRETVFPLIKQVGQCQAINAEFISGMKVIFNQFCASRDTLVIKREGALNPEQSIDLPLGDIPYFLSHILLLMKDARADLLKARAYFQNANVLATDPTMHKLLLKRVSEINAIISEIDTIHAKLHIQNENINNCAKHGKLEDVENELGRVPISAVEIDKDTITDVERLRDDLSRKVIESRRKSVLIARTAQVADSYSRQARHKSVIADQARQLLSRYQREDDIQLGPDGDASDISLIPRISALLGEQDKQIADLEEQVSKLNEMHALKNVNPCALTRGERVVKYASYTLPLVGAGLGVALAKKSLEIALIAGFVSSTPPGLLIGLGFVIGCLVMCIVRMYLMHRSQKRTNHEISHRATFMKDNPVFAVPELPSREELLRNVRISSDGTLRM